MPGGSANAYDYAGQDPVNNTDLGGMSYSAGDRGGSSSCGCSGSSNWTYAYSYYETDSWFGVPNWKVGATTWFSGKIFGFMTGKLPLPGFNLFGFTPASLSWDMAQEQQRTRHVISTRCAGGKLRTRDERFFQLRYRITFREDFLHVGLWRAKEFSQTVTSSWSADDSLWAGGRGWISYG